MSTTPTRSSSPSSLLHTYHCLCATLLLCTPYSIPHLPTRAAPSRDKARILPLPPIQPSSSSSQKRRSSPPFLPPPPLPLSAGPSASSFADAKGKSKEISAATEVAAAVVAAEEEEDENENENDNENDNEEEGGDEEDDHPGGDDEREHENQYLPSLILPSLRPARKLIIVRREDGWERRRVWRCARCGLGIGYEVEEEGGGVLGGEGKDKKLRVMFLLEGGLVETGDWDEKGDGDGVAKGGVVEGGIQEKG